MLNSSVTEEKRDILTYFKRVGIAKSQEKNSSSSSSTSKSHLTEGSSGSDKDEIKSGSSEVTRKRTNDVSVNSKNDLNINEITKPKGQKDTTLTFIDLTDEAQGNCDKEREVKTKEESMAVCKINGKEPDKALDSGKHFSNCDKKEFPKVGCKEETVKDKNDLLCLRSPEAKGESSLEVVANSGNANIKDIKKTPLPNSSAEVRKNAFTFLMANRVRQTETGKTSEEERSLNHGEEEDDNLTYDRIRTSGDTAVKKCETERKKKATSKKKPEFKNSEKDDKNERIDLDSSLQDFDLEPDEKPKKKRCKKPNFKKEKITTTSCPETAAPCDSNNLNSSNDVKPSNSISFTEFMKSVSSTTKEGAIEGSSGGETGDIEKREESVNKSETNKSEQQQTANSDCCLNEALGKQEIMKIIKADEAEQDQITNANSTSKISNAEKDNYLQHLQPVNTNSIVKIADEVKENVVLSKSYPGECQQQSATSSTSTIKKEEVKKTEGASSSMNKNKLVHQKTLDNHNDSSENNEHCNSVFRENVSLVDCDRSAKITKLTFPSKVNEIQEDQIDQDQVEELPKPKQVTSNVQRKRVRKRKIVSSDSEEDVKTSRSNGVPKERNSKVKEDSKSNKSSEASNVLTIASFFRSISHKEKDKDKDKVVFTVQADVHAPLDGNNAAGKKLSSPLHAQGTEELGETCDPRNGGDDSNIQGIWKSTPRAQKGVSDKHSLDELNKIELLEQIPSAKSVIKKTLKKTEKIDEEATEDYIEKVKKKTLATTKRELPKRTLNARKSVRNTVGVRKKSLRRIKYESSSSDESSEELFLRKNSKSPCNDKDPVEVASNNASNSSISIDECPEDGEEKPSSAAQSSEGSEDDKENVAHYTSQLLRRPGKLRLVIKKIFLLYS